LATIRALTKQYSENAVISINYDAKEKRNKDIMKNNC
jgi:hypothetical protein